MNEAPGAGAEAASYAPARRWCTSPTTAIGSRSAVRATRLWDNRFYPQLRSWLLRVNCYPAAPWTSTSTSSLTPQTGQRSRAHTRCARKTATTLPRSSGDRLRARLASLDAEVAEGERWHVAAVAKIRVDHDRERQELAKLEQPPPMPEVAGPFAESVVDCGVIMGRRVLMPVEQARQVLREKRASPEMVGRSPTPPDALAKT
jgi:hypothetical protein